MFGQLDEHCGNKKVYLDRDFELKRIKELNLQDLKKN